jgi:hypothetical protein
MKKQLTFMIGIFILLTLFGNFVSSELYLWETTIKDTSLNNTANLVKDHLYYYFQDTSLTGRGADVDTPITLTAVILALPFNFTQYNPSYNGSVDWCNFSYLHVKNTFDNSVNPPRISSTTNEQGSFFYENTGTVSTQEVIINMRSVDSLFADVKCHYTDSTTLYIENVLVGRFTTYLPSYSCAKCTQYSLEELSHLQEKNEQITDNTLGAYSVIQRVIDYNFQIWVIISYIFKIAIVLVAIGLIFSGIYYFYKYMEKLVNEV